MFNELFSADLPFVAFAILPAVVATYLPAEEEVDGSHNKD